MEEALKAVGVRRSYGGQEVLKGLDLSIAPGSFEAMMGPSGCGKSTFLHIAAGLLGADAGEVFVGGTDIVGMGDAAAAKFRRRHVGVVFQAFNLLEGKTVRENILLPLKLDGVKTNSPEVQERYSSLVARLGLDGICGKRPEELSGGERQRVAMARALIAAPDIVLADEPTGNLDAQSSKSICSLLGEINGAERSAILVVTHDPQVAACAGRVHFLKDGVIAASCDTEHDAAKVSKLYLETFG